MNTADQRSLTHLSLLISILLACLVCSTLSAQADPDSVTGRLRLIGNGALGLTSGENVSTGAFGVDYRDENFRMMTLITIESSAGGLTSTRRQEFRENVLPVRNTDDGFYVFGRWKKMNWVGGVQVYLNSGSTLWTFQEENNGVITQTSQDVTLTAGGINIIFEPLYKYTVLKNDIQFFLGAGVTARHIGGDAGADSTFRNSILGTQQTLFWGPEGVAILQINDVDVTFTLPILGLIGGDDVSGLTGTQSFGTVNVQAGLDLVLRRRKRSADAEIRPSPPPPPPPPPSN